MPLERLLGNCERTDPAPASLVWAYFTRAHLDRSAFYLRFARAIALAHGLVVTDDGGCETPTDLLVPGRELDHREVYVVEGLWRARRVLTAGPLQMQGWLEGDPFAPMARRLPPERGQPLAALSRDVMAALEAGQAVLERVDAALFEALGVKPAAGEVTVDDVLRQDPGLAEHLPFA